MENSTETQEEYTFLVVASKWQAASYGPKKFDKTQAKLLRKERAVPTEFVERVNNSYNETGLFFKINKEKTKAFYKEKEENVIKAAKAKEITDNALNVAASAIAIAADQSKTKHKPSNNG